MARHRDPEIDPAILDILQNRQTAGYNEVYHLLRKKHRHVSRDAYDRHIRGLKESGNIQRKDKGAKGGRKGQFCITDKGKQTLRLFGSFPEYKRALTLRLERAFQLLLLFEAKKEIEFEDKIYGTEDELVKLVRSKYDVPFTKKDLVIEHQFRKPVDCTVTVYGPISSCIQIVKKEFDILKSETAGTDLTLRQYTRHANNTKKVLYTRSNKSRKESVQSKNDNQETALFLIKTLGITINEIVNYKKFAFKHLGFTSGELQEAFNTLKDEGLIKPKGVLGDDIYYTIASDSLYHLIRDCWILHNQIMEKMSLVWMYFRRPTWHERKWLEVFFGPQRARSRIKDDNKFRLQIRYKQRLEQSRMKEEQQQLQKPATKNHDTPQEEKIFAAIDEKTATSMINSVKDKIVIYDRLSKADVKLLKEKHAMTIRKYSFPYDVIMSDLVYPSFLQEIASTISSAAQKNRTSHGKSLYG
jgi:predicted transcriptional regulator